MSIAEVQVEAEIETFADKDPWYSVALDLIKRKPLGAAGAFIVLIMILMALFAELIAPYDPELNNYEFMLVGPDWTFLLGTDQFGRDIFSRIVYGARTALFVGFVSAFVGSAIGLVLGVTSAYFGGKFDLVFQRVMDVFMSFPLIILALAVVSIFGTGTQNVILAITIPFIPRCARVVRSLHRCGTSLRLQPHQDHPQAYGAQRDGSVFNHVHRIRWPGNPAGSLAELPWTRCPGTCPGVGTDASGGC